MGEATKEKVSVVTINVSHVNLPVKKRLNFLKI